MIFCDFHKFYQFAGLPQFVNPMSQLRREIRIMQNMKEKRIFTRYGWSSTMARFLTRKWVQMNHNPRSIFMIVLKEPNEYEGFSVLPTETNCCVGNMKQIRMRHYMWRSRHMHTITKTDLCYIELQDVGIASSVAVMIFCKTEISHRNTSSRTGLRCVK